MRNTGKVDGWPPLPRVFMRATRSARASPQSTQGPSVADSNAGSSTSAADGGATSSRSRAYQRTSPQARQTMMVNVPCAIDSTAGPTQATARANGPSCRFCVA